MLYFRPYLEFAALLGLSLAVVVGLQWYRSRPVRSRAAFDGWLLPGAARRAALQRLERSATVDAILLVATPLLVYALLLTRLQFGGGDLKPAAAIVTGLAAAGFGLYFALRLRATLRNCRAGRQAVEDILAAALELNSLPADRWSVYHDFHAGHLAVDHVVVGTGGVFAVQTASPRRPPRQHPTAAYDGRALYFRSRTDSETPARARRAAAELSRWIRTATGETVAARAVVILPGWRVRRTASSGIPVIGLPQIGSLFQHVRPRPLSPPAMKSIAAKIESQCAVRRPGRPRPPAA